MSTSSQHAALSFCLCWVRLGYLLHRALVSRIIGNTHSQIIGSVRRRRAHLKKTFCLECQRLLWEALAWPLLCVSPQYLFLSLSLHPSRLFPPSFLYIPPIIQSASPLLSVILTVIFAASAVVAVWCTHRDMQTFVSHAYTWHVYDHQGFISGVTQCILWKNLT